MNLERLRKMGAWNRESLGLYNTRATHRLTTKRNIALPSSSSTRSGAPAPGKKKNFSVGEKSRIVSSRPQVSWCPPPVSSFHRPRSDRRRPRRLSGPCRRLFCADALFLILLFNFGFGVPGSAQELFDLRLVGFLGYGLIYASASVCFAIVVAGV